MIFSVQKDKKIDGIRLAGRWECRRKDVNVRYRVFFKRGKKRSGGKI